MNPLMAWTPSAPDMIIILVIGVLLFGRKLPEIGRYLGKGIVEFKKGLKGMEDEVSDGGTPSYSSSAPVSRQEPVSDQIQNRPPQRVTASAPKFEEPAAPKFEAPAAPKFEEPPAAPKPEEKPAAAPAPPPHA